MILEQIRVGGDRNFAYLVADDESSRAAVVDPAFDPDEVLRRAASKGLQIEILINTHRHYDHSGGNEVILEKTGARLMRGGPGGVEDGETVDLGGVRLEFLHTPGHTDDCICVLAGENGGGCDLFTGDTLFVGKVGGTGYGDDAREEYESIHEKLMKLPDETVVWPGHDYGTSPVSSIGYERTTNPFILRDSFESFVDLKRHWRSYKREHGIR